MKDRKNDDENEKAAKQAIKETLHDVRMEEIPITSTLKGTNKDHPLRKKGAPGVWLDEWFANEMVRPRAHAPRARLLVPLRRRLPSLRAVCLSRCAACASLLWQVRKVMGQERRAELAPPDRSYIAWRTWSMVQEYFEQYRQDDPKRMKRFEQSCRFEHGHHEHEETRSDIETTMQV